MPEYASKKSKATHKAIKSNESPSTQRSPFPRLNALNRTPKASQHEPLIPTLERAETEQNPQEQPRTFFGGPLYAKVTAVQREVVRPALSAAHLYSQEVQRLEAPRQALQRQAQALPMFTPTQMEQAIQREQKRSAPTPIIRHPQTNADWVTVMSQQAEQAEGRRMSSRENEQFKNLQRQVAQRLALSYRQDSRPAGIRTAEYAGHLVALQRHPISAQVARVALSMASPGEQPTLQRAVDEALQREAEQYAQDAGALQLHALQRQLADLDEQANQSVMQRIQARRGAGNPLPADVLRQLEQGLNHDLSAVRIHDDAEADKLAKSVNAIAFTTGTDIFFQTGKYNPGSATGYELLAHETTHVVQQSKGKVGQGIDPDAGLEQEARSKGAALRLARDENGRLNAPPTRGRSLAPFTAGHAVQRQAVKAATPQSSQTQSTRNTPSENAVVLALIELLGQADTRYKPNVNSASYTIVKAALKSQKDNATYWESIAEQGSKIYGQHFTKHLLTYLPPEFKNALELALLGGEVQVTKEAFMNQLAFMSYGNATNLSDIKGMRPTKDKSVAQGAQAILDAAGYEAEPTIQGLWGFQMRIFKPRKDQTAAQKKISSKTVVAFRGTEKVMLGSKSDTPIEIIKAVAPIGRTEESQKLNQSFLDSMTDFLPYPTGYTQYQANEELIIKPTILRLKSNLVAVGHSLGSALAQLAVAKFPNLFSEVHTFQGAKIQKEDVEKAEKQNKNILAKHYSVNGDVVPGSGQKAFPGMVNRFDRSAKALSVGASDAAGGHNSPIMIEQLRKFQGNGAMSKSNPLANAINQYGSHDDVSNAVLAPVQVSTQQHPDKEGQKQDVIGLMQMKAFVKIFQNNFYYNAYSEMALKQLINFKPIDKDDLFETLADVHRKVTSKEITINQSKSALLTIHAIFDKPTSDAEKARERVLKNIADHTASPTEVQTVKEYDRAIIEYKRLRLEAENVSKIGSSIIESNKAMLLFSIIDLWYSVNSNQKTIYEEVRPQWQNQNKL